MSWIDEGPDVEVEADIWEEEENALEMEREDEFERLVTKELQEERERFKTIEGVTLNGKPVEIEINSCDALRIVDRVGLTDAQKETST